MSLGSSSGCRVFEPWIPNLVAGSEGDKIGFESPSKPV